MEENLKNGNTKSEHGILQLAYLGDAVIELLTRSELLALGNYHSGVLVKMSKRFITCEAQSDAVERILPHLTEGETAVYKRGRNAKTHFSPNHGELIQYRRATGLEALFGHLYISGDEVRLRELFELAYGETLLELRDSVK